MLFKSMFMFVEKSFCWVEVVMAEYKPFFI
jgi:hypothetical protein